MYSNELKKVILLFFKKSQKSNQNIYSFFLLLAKQKGALSSKIFNQLYRDPNLVLKNFENLISQQEKKEKYKKIHYDFGFTPVLEKLLYKTCLKSKKGRIITTEDVFLALLNYKQIKDILKLANRKSFYI